ncbi:MAG: hypothetical protein JNK49_18420 [Planctomycetes bacterium]|nr:hypothetical protein [Planctomycetota bacterium]
MPNVLFAAPPVARFHLHERLQRELRRRGHQTTWLLVDGQEARFVAAQEQPVVLVQSEPDAGCLDEAAGWAAADLLLRGLAPTGRRWRKALALRSRWLGSHWSAVERCFDRVRPDLVLCHQRRGGVPALVQFAARERGIPVLWTGDGLLPHTQQIDVRGLDGDASGIGQPAAALRVASREPKLLAACLAHGLGGGAPVGLPPAGLLGRSWADRFGAALGNRLGAREPDLPRALGAALRDLPERPFVTLLLQAELAPQRCLDAELVATDALVRAARQAVAGLDPGLALVVVAQPRASLLARRRLAALGGGTVLPAAAAGVAAAAALAVLTVNHPAAAIGLLAGTPVVHCGRALYGLPTVTTGASVPTLAAALARAVGSDAPLLRERWLTQLFAVRHLWCSATEPDHNGLLGLVAALEAALGAGGGGRIRSSVVKHRIGPPWPLDRNG